MTDANLAVMHRALLRLMGMLFIETARLLLQVQDDRLRAGAGTDEVVEVEVDEDDGDDESLYMQTRLSLTKADSWETILQRLVRLADTGGHGGLVRALYHRISQSFYLTSSRGTQLQAALVALRTTANDSQAVELCDTEPNDANLVEEWWQQLKEYLHFDMVESTASSSHAGGSEPGNGGSGGLANPAHHQAMVEAWEEERQADASRAAAEARLYEQREQEEAEQDRRDRALYEEHRAAAYREWEEWVLLNTPNTVKRRRLQVQVQPAEGESKSTGGVVSAELDLPGSSGEFGLQLRVKQVETDPMATSRAKPTAADSGRTPDIESEVYQKTYQAWRDGRMPDALVVDIFGEDWLFLFQVTANGVDGDTMQGLVVEAAVDDPPLEAVRTQIDEEGGTQHGVSWHRALQGGAMTMELDDSWEPEEVEVRPNVGEGRQGPEEEVGAGRSERG